MFALATLLYVQRETGSFAVAGLVSAGSLVGVALGSVVQGRIIDRLGPTRPLLVAAVLFAAGRGRPDRRRRGRCPAGPGARRAAARRGRAAGTAGVVPGAVEPPVAAGPRGTPPTPTRRSAWRCSSSSARRSRRCWSPRRGPAPGRRGRLGLAMVVGAIGFALTPAVRAGEAGGAGRSAGRHARRAGQARHADGRAGRARASALVVGVVEVGVPAVAAAAGSRDAGRPAALGVVADLGAGGRVLRDAPVAAPAAPAPARAARRRSRCWSRRWRPRPELAGRAHRS